MGFLAGRIQNNRMVRTPLLDVRNLICDIFSANFKGLVFLKYMGVFSAVVSFQTCLHDKDTKSSEGPSQ